MPVRSSFRVEVGNLVIDISVPAEPAFLTVNEASKRGYVLRSRQTGLERFMTREELSELHLADMVRVCRVNCDRLGVEWLPMLATDFEAWPKEMRSTARMRERYCLRVLHLLERDVPMIKACARAAGSVFRLHGRKWNEERAYLLAQAEARDEPQTRKPQPVLLHLGGTASLKQPGELIVYHWVKRYRASNGNLCVLLDRFHARGRGGPRKTCKSDLKVDAAEPLCVYGAMRHAGSTIFLKLANARKKEAYNGFLATCKRIGCEVMSRQTFYRFLDRNYTAFEVYKAKWGERAAYYRFGFFNERKPPDKLLEQVEVDHTLLNIWLDDESGKLRRPWLTLFLDRASRCVLGFHLSFSSPSYGSVQRALRHSLEAKDVAHLGVENEWLCEGPFELVFSDRGSDLCCGSFRAALDLLGTLLVSLPGGTPHLRGMIERFFRTVKEALLLLNGAFPSGVDRPSEYRPRSGLSLGEFNAWLTRWIVDDYHQKRHETLGCSPDARWRTLAATQTFRSLPQHARLDLLLAYRFTAKARNGAIHRTKRIYWSPAFAALLNRVGHGKRWEARFNPDKPDCIQVLDDTSVPPTWVRLDFVKPGTSRVTQACREAAQADQNLEPALKAMLRRSTGLEGTESAPLDMESDESAPSPQGGSALGQALSPPLAAADGTAAQSPSEAPGPSTSPLRATDPRSSTSKLEEMILRKLAA